MDTTKTDIDALAEGLAQVDVEAIGNNIVEWWHWGPKPLAAALAATPPVAALLARAALADELAAQLKEMVSLAKSGAAEAHLNDAGILQDPPHWGKFSECEAPWCVRNQKRLAVAEDAIAKWEASHAK